MASRLPNTIRRTRYAGLPVLSSRFGTRSAHKPSTSKAKAPASFFSPRAAQGSSPSNASPKPFAFGQMITPQSNIFSKLSSVNPSRTKLITLPTRPIKPADIPALARLCLQSVESDEPASEFEGRLLEHLMSEDGSVTTFVALHPRTGVPLGFVAVNERSPLPTDCRMTAYVGIPADPPELSYQFATAPDEGGSQEDVKSALMMRVLQEERWTRRGIWLLCYEANQPELDFHKKWGFVEVGIKENTEEGDEPEKILWLKGKQ